jgi:nucleotide-binding universal stress UspA family protein
MYQRIVLASDGARESLVALREGALIARAFGAKAHLLIIVRDDTGRRLADGHYAVSPSEDAPRLLEVGLDRLRRLGVPVTGEIAYGDPTQLIADCVRRFEADLVVLGHRRQSLLERWWSGPSGAYVADGVPCSLLIARDMITDAEFEAHLAPPNAGASDQS